MGTCRARDAIAAWRAGCGEAQVRRWRRDCHAALTCSFPEEGSGPALAAPLLRLLPPRPFWAPPERLSPPLFLSAIQPQSNPTGPSRATAPARRRSGAPRTTRRTLALSPACAAAIHQSVVRASPRRRGILLPPLVPPPTGLCDVGAPHRGHAPYAGRAFSTASPTSAWFRNPFTPRNPFPALEAERQRVHQVAAEEAAHRPLRRLLGSAIHLRRAIHSLSTETAASAGDSAGKKPPPRPATWSAHFPVAPILLCWRARSLSIASPHAWK